MLITAWHLGRRQNVVIYQFVSHAGEIHAIYTTGFYGNGTFYSDPIGQFSIENNPMKKPGD